MIKIMAKTMAVVCALVGFASMASAGYWDCCFTPYIGLDAQGRHVDFNNRFGGNVFKKDYPQGNLYFGTKLTQFFGLEAGYEWTKRMHRTVSLGTSEAVFGVPVRATAAPSTIRGKSKFDGWHANVIGFLPVTDDCCTELFASLGIVQMRAAFEGIAIAAGVDTIDPQESIFFRQTKTIARANLGIQTKIVDAFGIRASIGWENTSRIRPFVNDIASPLATQIKVKDSFIYGLGISYTFC